MAKTTISLAAGCMNELGRSFFGFLQAFNKFLIKGVQRMKNLSMKCRLKSHKRRKMSYWAASSANPSPSGG
jgi:hypothetical protein